MTINNINRLNYFLILRFKTQCYQNSITFINQLVVRKYLPETKGAINNSMKKTKWNNNNT